MTVVAAFISMLVAVLTFINWRVGFLAVLGIGVLQDVLRKLTPGVPSYFIVWAAAVYLGIVAFAILVRALPPATTIFLDNRRVKLAWVMFLALVFIHLANALIRWGNPAVPVFGAMFYLGPVVAMLASCGFVDRWERIIQYLRVYLWIYVPVCLTVFLSPALQDTVPVLKEVGAFVGRQLIIYDQGAVLESYSGLMRVGEIASWHASTAAMFLGAFALAARGNGKRIVFGLIIAALVAVIVLTGRRKMLMALAVFFVGQWALIAWYRRGMGRWVIVMFLVGTISSFSLTLLEPNSEASLYAQRGTSVFRDIEQRWDTSVMLMKSAYNRSRGLGLGAGTASQGASYANVRQQARQVGGSAEAGIGKFMVELGVLGLILGAWLIFQVSRTLVMNLRTVLAFNEKVFLFQASFIAIIFANLMTFMVATQVYGDFFILIVLGTIAGFILKINDSASAWRKSSAQIGNISRTDHPGVPELGREGW